MCHSFSFKKKVLFGRLKIILESSWDFSFIFLVLLKFSPTGYAVMEEKTVTCACL